MVHLVVANSGPHQLPDIGRSFGGSDASRIHTSVRCNVVDFTAGDADVRKLAVRQATQLGTQPFAFCGTPEMHSNMFREDCRPAALRLRVPAR